MTKPGHKPGRLAAEIDQAASAAHDAVPDWLRVPKQRTQPAPGVLFVQPPEWPYDDGEDDGV